MNEDPPCGGPAVCHLLMTARGRPSKAVLP